MLGFAPLCELPLCGVPDDSWTPTLPLPTAWAPELEPVNPWTPED